MLEKKPPRQDDDPDEVLVGICATCHAKVECPRLLATRPPIDRAVGKEPGTWNDLVYAECPRVEFTRPDGSFKRCGARVYLTKKV